MAEKFRYLVHESFRTRMPLTNPHLTTVHDQHSPQPHHFTKTVFKMYQEKKHQNHMKSPFWGYLLMRDTM